MSERLRIARGDSELDERFSSEAVTDEALMAAIASRDHKAALTFVRRYQRRVYGLALSVVTDRSLAEDIAQEAFIRVWRHAAVFDPRRASVATWVLRITRNLAIDALRLRRAVPVDPEELTGLFIAGDAPLESNAIQLDEMARVRRVVATLPPEQQSALMRAAYYGQSASEISDAEGIPLGTAKSRIRLALAKVRGELVNEEV